MRRLFIRKSGVAVYNSCAPHRAGFMDLRPGLQDDQSIGTTRHVTKLHPVRKSRRSTTRNFCIDRARVLRAVVECMSFSFSIRSFPYRIRSWKMEAREPHQRSPTSRRREVGRNEAVPGAADTIPAAVVSAQAGTASNGAVTRNEPSWIGSVPCHKYDGNRTSMPASG